MQNGKWEIEEIAAMAGYSTGMDICRIKKVIKKQFQPLDVIWAIENAIQEDQEVLVCV